MHINFLLIFLSMLFLATVSFSILVVNQTSPECTVGDAYFSDIQSAIDDSGAEANGTIIVCNDGTYTGPVVINKSLNIYGNEYGVTIISPDGDNVVNITADYVNITNLTVQNATNVFAAGFWLTGNNTRISQSIARNNSYGFFVFPYSSFNNLSNNNASNNNLSGFYLDRNVFNNLINNNASNNTQYGFYIGGSFLIPSYNNTLVNNNVFGYNNTDDGFFIFESSNNSLTNNNAFNVSGYGFYIYGSVSTPSDNNTLTNNNVYGYGNTVNGFYLDTGSNNTFLSNSVYNASQGFYLTYCFDNNFTNNIANNNSNDGFDITDSDYNNFVSNIANYNGDNGFGIFYSDYNTFSLNNASNNDDGLYLSDSGNNNLTDNNVSNNSDYGFYLSSSSSDNNITSNTAQENGLFDLYLDLGQSCSNTIENMTGSGGRPINYTNTSVNWSDFEASEVILCYADNSNLTNITVSGSDTLRNNGLLVLGSVNISIQNSNSYSNFIGLLSFVGLNATLANNTLSDNIFGLYLLITNVSFAGNNYILSTIGYEVLTFSLGFNTTISTGQYNISTDNLDFGIVNATDISLKVVNLSDSGASVAISSISGLSNVGSAKVVQSAQGNYYVLNVSNTSSTASFTPRLYYNSSDLSGYSTTYLNVGRYTGSTWSTLSTTVNDTDSYIYGTSTSFSYFAPIVYSLESGDGEDEQARSLDVGVEDGCSEQSPVDYDPSLAYYSPGMESSYMAAYSANNGYAIVTVTDNEPVSGAQVTLSKDGYEPSENTNSSGEASFYGLSNGKYNITISKGGYDDVTDSVTIDCEKCPNPPTGQSLAHATWDKDQCTWKCLAEYTMNDSRECVKTEQPPQTNITTGGTTTQTSCSSDADCLAIEHCSGGTCIAVTGECGHATNHQWIKYECCNDGDCAQTMKCSAEHVCVQKKYTLELPPNATVGDSIIVKAYEEGKPMPNATVSVKLPNNNVVTLKTGANGQTTMLVEYEGNYTASLVGENKVLESKYLTSSPKQVGGEGEKKPPALWDQPAVKTIGIVLLIGLVLGAIYLYFRGKGGTGAIHKGFKN